MEILGIIAEYNPFHNGHLLHLSKSQELVDADYTICLMSGNFMQRGEPAIVDKWSRAKMAIDAGADLIIEIPTVYTTQSAEFYAKGAMKLIKEIGIINSISFGSECGDITMLENLADLFLNEPKEFKELIKEELSKGFAYPKALSNAIYRYFPNGGQYAEILDQPNNVLGVEYIKAIKSENLNTTALTIQRDSDYTDGYEDYSSGIASGMTIRNMLRSGENISNVVPYSSYEILEDKILNNELIYSLQHFEKPIFYSLRTKIPDELKNIAGISEGLENRLSKAGFKSNNLDELIQNIASKRYTYAKSKRLLISNMLNITKQDIENANKITPYIRVLAFNENGRKLISLISRNNPKADIIVSVKSYLKNAKNKNRISMLEKDILATDIYTLGYDFNMPASLDFTTSLLD